MAPTRCHTGGCQAREQIICKAQGFSCRAKRGARPEHQHRYRITADHFKITVGTPLRRTCNQQTPAGCGMSQVCVENVTCGQSKEETHLGHQLCRGGGQGCVTACPAAITAQRGRVASLQTLQSHHPELGYRRSGSLARQGSPILAACPALKQGMAFSKHYLPQKEVFLPCC